MTKIPAVVILPRSTEEVQKIVKVCNRYKVPMFRTARGFTAPGPIATLTMNCWST